LPFGRIRTILFRSGGVKVDVVVIDVVVVDLVVVVFIDLKLFDILTSAEDWSFKLLEK
jgi:hypothetical protein